MAVGDHFVRVVSSTRTQGQFRRSLAGGSAALFALTPATRRSRRTNTTSGSDVLLSQAFSLSLPTIGTTKGMDAPFDRPSFDRPRLSIVDSGCCRPFLPSHFRFDTCGGMRLLPIAAAGSLRPNFDRARRLGPWPDPFCPFAVQPATAHVLR
jgi:hypothetical protein